MLAFHLLICLNVNVLYRHFCCDASTYEPRIRDKRDISHILKKAKHPARHQILDVFNEDDTNNLTKILDTRFHFKTGKESKNKREKTRITIPIDKVTEKLKSSQQVLEGITVATNQKTNDNINNTKTDLSSLREMFKTFWEKKKDKLFTPKNVTSKFEDIKATKQMNSFSGVTERSSEKVIVIEKNGTTHKKEMQMNQLEVTLPPRPDKCPSSSHPRKHILWFIIIE
jgi:hypothetical protein